MTIPTREPRYELDPVASTFRIEHYQWAPPFSDFLPAIAGEWGVPAWAFLVNRGQALSGLGVGDRSGQILELYSFNKACSRVESEGFRTFLRIDGEWVAEPFRRRSPGWVHALELDPATVRLEARHEALGVRIDIAYCIVPGRRVPGVLRDVTITDLLGTSRRLEVLDGAPRLLPAGLSLHEIKRIPRHIEAMIVTRRPDPATALYQLAQVPADDSAVAPGTASHFLRCWWSDGAAHLVVDPTAAFGDPFAFDEPTPFVSGGAESVRLAEQLDRGRTPSGLVVWSGELARHQSVRIASILGRCDDEDLTPLADLDHAAAFDQLQHDARRVIDRLAHGAFTVSASPQFDAYCRQNHLDNLYRGGVPVRLPGRTVYAFSHQNFDLERDYHDFVVAPTYLSQGMGHFRNTLQNRRNDVFLSPDSGEANLRLFFGLVQLDGYNPLEVLPEKYVLTDHDRARAWAARHVADRHERGKLLERMSSPLSLGELAMLLETASGEPAGTDPAALVESLAFLGAAEVGGIHAGFWIDHWHYLVDLLERHLAVFPDEVAAVLLGEGYTWFDNPDIVTARHDRYALTEDGPRQWGEVRRDREKELAITIRPEPRHRARDDSGEVFSSTLLEKLLVLVATRLATLDAGGLGIEMEAGKPGWNDSLNGLPGLFGSAISAALELRRTMELLTGWLGALDKEEVDVFEELSELLAGVAALVEDRLAGSIDGFGYWDAVNHLKESYRERVRLGVSGSVLPVPLSQLMSLCSNGVAMLDRASRAGGRDADGLPLTYLTALPSLQQGDAGLRATGFETRSAGTFLEGAVHWIRTHPGDAAAVHAAVGRSALYDRVLGMYRSSAPMSGADPRMGRAVGAYPGGWLEHASIYTHMEYKYLLELLRSGLVAEFWETAQKCLVPFMDAAAYGRSPLQGSSFIVSSAYADASEHGRGYQPRLSGMTAEFVSMWLEAALGPEPFRFDGGLSFSPAPRLPGSMFTPEPVTRRHVAADGRETVRELPAGTYACTALAGTLLSFRNPSRSNTYGPEAVGPVAFEVVHRDGSEWHVDGDELRGEPAIDLRRGDLAELVVLLDR